MRTLAPLLPLLLLGAACTPPGPTPARSAVLVTIDTLRADHVGAYGGPVPTPHLDGIAAEGVRVEQACTPMPTTGPAHASLLTGLHPWRHGTLRNAVRLDPRLPTVAGALGARGFATAAFVSSFVLAPRFGFDRDFATYGFEPTERYTWRGVPEDRFWARGAATVGAAVDWLRDHAGERFFLWVHLFDPHRPYRPPPGFELPADVAVDLTHKKVPRDVAGPEALAEHIRGYRGEVAYADAQIGALEQALRDLDLLDSTALVVTSDHGEGLGDHGILEHGKNLFDELVRVPLLLRGPGLPAGALRDGPAQLEDLAPTLLRWLGIPPETALAGPDGSAAIDGLDLLPWLRGDAPHSPRAAAVGRRRDYRNVPETWFSRRFPAKWIGPRSGPGRRFDLRGDPTELRPMRGTGPPPPLQAALARPPAAPPRARDPAPEVRRALEALGYAED